MEENAALIKSTLDPKWVKERALKFSRPDFSDTVAAYTASLCKSETFSDVEVIVDGQHFPCHRMVLAAGSLYFETMFKASLKEATSRTVELQSGIKKEVFSDILEYLYCGTLTINFNNIQGLLQASDMMFLDPLKQGCIEFYQNLISKENCLGIWQVSDQFNAPILKCQALEHALEHFETVFKHPEFLELSSRSVSYYLAHKNLCVKREEQTVEAFIMWIGHDPESRASQIMDILPKLRLLSQNKRIIKQKLIDHPVIKASAEAQSFLMSILNHMLYKEPTPQEFLLQPIRSTIDKSTVCVILGGFKERRRSNQCHAISYEENTDNTSGIGTSLLCDMPSVYNIEMASCVVGNIIYVSGIGYTSDEMWKLDVNRMSWSRCHSLLKGRICHSMVTSCETDNQIYILGGYSEIKNKVYGNIEAYDIPTNSIEQVGTLITPIACCTAQIFSGFIYTFGGAAEHERPSSCIQMFNIDFNEVTLLPIKLPSPALRLKSQMCLNNLVVIGTKVSFVIDMPLLHNTVQDLCSANTDAKFQGDFHGIIQQKKGIGKDLFGLELLGDKLFTVGGRFDENDDNLDNKIETIQVSDYLNSDEAGWKTVGKVQTPVAIYISAVVDMKKKQPDVRVTAL